MNGFLGHLECPNLKLWALLRAELNLVCASANVLKLHLDDITIFQPQLGGTAHTNSCRSSFF